MKKLRCGGFIATLFAVLLISVVSAHAALELRGTDSLGNQLIYDTDLNVTWYDYSFAPGVTFSGTINYGGVNYSNWRLPHAWDDAECLWVSGCTANDMGHLYYTEFGNTSSSGLANKSPFLNLLPKNYATDVWYGGTFFVYFNFSNGLLYEGESGHTTTPYRIVVLDGDVPQQPVAPEPISSILFVTGGTLLAGRRFLRKKA